MRAPGPIICAVFLLGTIAPLSATPIRPDIKKLVSEPAENTVQFAPARAGWNGPETAQNNDEAINPAAERLSPAATARAARQSLIAAAVPDWRAILAILCVILVLRFARRRPTPKATPEQAPDSNQIQAEERLKPAA